MPLVRAVVYLATCAWLVLALPSAGEAFLASGGDLLERTRAGVPAARAFLAGGAAFVPCAVLLRRFLRFWYTLAHELSHGLAALALGGHPEELVASAAGRGQVTFLRAPVLFWLVLVAPYVLNPSHLLAVLVPLLREEVRTAGAGVAGFATAFALVANAIQVRAYQSDLRRVGLLRSLLFIAWGNLTATALAAALALRGFDAAAARALLAFRPVWP